MAEKSELPGGTFGANVRAAREARDWTMTQLAKRAGIDPGTVSRWEADLRQPELASILALATALEMTGSALIENL